MKDMESSTVDRGRGMFTFITKTEHYEHNVNVFP